MDTVTEANLPSPWRAKGGSAFSTRTCRSRPRRPRSTRSSAPKAG
jgi:hypothetical protein